MLFRRAVIVLAALAALLSGAPARALDASDRLAAHLAAGTLAAGEAELAGLAKANPDDAQAKAGLGVIRFARAIERFAQAMYRHGFQPGGRAYGPMFAMPLPFNPKPEPLDYQGLRAIFAALSDDLRAADATLAEVGDKSVKFVLPLEKIRVDIDGDGTASERETLIGLALGEGAPTQLKEEAAVLTVAFDTADIYWLRGYSNLLGTIADFWLAYDFQETFDQTFHVLFPRASLPLAGKLATGTEVQGMSGDEIADAIALFHLIRWPVAEPARLEAVRQRFLQVIALNRLTWTSVKGETDDDREWLPSPTQKNAVLSMFSVTQERLDAWFAALGEMEDVLEGRKLMPHWRFQKGVNLKRVAQEPRPLDLVLWVTGHAALPYLEDGPVADWAAWRQADRLFEGNLLTYAFWFN